MTDHSACRKPSSEFRKASVLVAILAVGAWVLVLPAGAADIVRPSADGTLVDGAVYGVFDGSPDGSDWSFGKSGYQGAITLATDSPTASLEHRVVWEYDLSGVTVQPPISATLSFTLRGAPVSPFPDVDVHIYSYPADLAGSAEDFSRGPAVLVGSVTVQSYQVPTAHTLDVTNLVKDALLSGDNKVAFRFQIDPGTVNGANQAFLDADDSDSATKPYISLETATAAADMDLDGDVDGIDFLTFVNCYNGSLKPIRPQCQNTAADLDGDGDVDGSDFLTFSSCYNGSLKPPKCLE